MEWHIIPTGRVWVEPGGALGLVPRPLWIEQQPVDDQNRVPMDLNCLLIRSEGKTILVDTGIGDKLSEKEMRHWGLEWPEGTLAENLAKHGVQPEEVDIVVNSHLHSDHCGGNTERVGGEAAPTFPNAEYWVQRMEFANATHPDPRTRNTYLKENFEPVWQRGQLKLLHGDTTITNQARCLVTRGHTRGHQCVILEEGDNPPVLFLADLASYALHMVHTSWVTAYDVEPLETITTKQRWQAWALKNEALLVFQHDIYTRLGRLFKDKEGKLEVESVERGSGNRSATSSL
jgi:glyoxylase-like metal-dependent hydrolase (beta-lactamase superfamily II)